MLADTPRTDTSTAAAAACACPSCGAGGRRVGPLPGSNLFAGRGLADVIPGGGLYRCAACSLGYRLPRLDKAQLDALYAAGSPSAWESATPQSRPDWQLAAEAVGREAAGNCAVLDIGCFDGGFLATLPAHVARAGIEIMPQAARSAADKGVRLIGTDFEALNRHAASFDVVTAFDVIEHVEDPLAFLRQVAAAAKPGGLLVISTGDLDAWSWRLMGSRYWYCAIPEHISFLSERWFRRAASALDLDLVATRRYAHAAASAPRKLREALTNVAFLVAPEVIGALRRRNRRPDGAQLHPSLLREYPPAWQTARDHILVTLRVRAAAER